MTDLDTCSPHVRLALGTIQSYVRDGHIIDVPEDIPRELINTRAGAFVCIKKDGHLRGCIGTIEPAQSCLAKEIIENAVCAATKDPRFLPIECRELDRLECSVDVLSPAEEIHDIRDLDPKRYGVIVENGSNRGLLLPDLDGVDTAEEQVSIARHKAFISPNDPIKLYRFKVNRFC
ncbi:MAG: AmmeMemoRadiSam system protein A [Armatimonadetes bacterium]|nr:AmmeMemoRadiSam system protein A [Armatimonadota bacterium]